MTHVILDVRNMAAADRPEAIFDLWAVVPAGNVLEVIDDHSLEPIHDRFRAAHPGEFTWVRVRRGPDVWRVDITRRTP